MLLMHVLKGKTANVIMDSLEMEEFLVRNVIKTVENVLVSQSINV